MKKWFYLLLIVGVLVGCSQQEDEASSNEPVNGESEENVLEEASTDSAVKAEVSEESKEDVEKEPDQKEEVTKTSQETEVKQQSPGTNEEQKVDEQEIDVEFIKNELTIGMTEQEVINLIGVPSKKGADAKNAEPLWLYNIRPAKGYYFEGPFENPEIIDALDSEGLKNREVDIILFLSWKEGKVDYISASYTDGKGNIKDYTLFEDGTIKES